MVALVKQPNMWHEPITVQRGDVWQLGQHKLMCGDSTSADDVRRLFGGQQFSLCFTSPPYSDQREYKLGAFNWHSLMTGAFDQIIANGTPDCHILINLGLSHKNRQVDMYWLEWLFYCSQVGWPLFGWYVWDKLNGMPHENQGRLMSTHEFIFHFNNEMKRANKWVETKGVSGGTMTCRQIDGSKLLHRGGLHTFGQSHKVPDSVIRLHPEKARNPFTIAHPATFPVTLPEFIMQTWSQPGDIVYEPFCGSGTSLIAGENLQRRVYAMEIEPSYCQLAIQRWQLHTGQQAQRVEVAV